MSAIGSRLASTKAWVEPAALPKYGDASQIKGNASDYVKQLSNNTLGAYGVGGPSCFAYQVGKSIRVLEINIRSEGNRSEAEVSMEVVVSENMLNGAGVVHGGCLCYIIDNCASLPLVALGLAQSVNGVGVSQVLNVFFHSPAALGVRLRITSTSMAMGGRVLTSRCEVLNDSTSKLVASAMLSKMQPNQNKL